MDFIEGRRYRLKRDVENPRLDRRSKREAQHAPWTAGLVFRARSERRYYCEEEFPPDLFLLEGVSGVSGVVKHKHPGFSKLVTELELLPETLEDVLAARYASATRVLELLIRDGKISMQDIKELLR